jgi:hypothetical protein
MRLTMKAIGLFSVLVGLVEIGELIYLLFSLVYYVIVRVMSVYVFFYDAVFCFCGIAYEPIFKAAADNPTFLC